MAQFERAWSAGLRDARPVLADLHVHLYGCIRPIDMLRHLKTCERVDWGWYEAEYEAAYGFVPATRELVEHYRVGDDSVIGAFVDLFVVGDADAGSFARFQAKANLIWAATDYTPGCFEREVLGYVKCNNVLINVTSRPGAGGAHPNVYRRYGIEIEHEAAVVLKMAADYGCFDSPDAVRIRIDTPGCSQSDLRSLDWSHVIRPIYGLDDDVTFSSDRAAVAKG